jgi:hypothetical protein
VIVVEYLRTDWYPRQLKLHTDPSRQQLYSDSVAETVYGSDVALPSRSVTSRSNAQLDSAGSVVLNDPYTIEIGDAEIEYPRGFEFTRKLQVALAMIQDSIGERPIHFASTGVLAEELGLASLSVRHGITSKLQISGDRIPGTLQMPAELGGEQIDLQRSLTLARDVFSYRGLRDREVWADSASLGIPYQFYLLHLQLAEGLRQAGGSEEEIGELMRDAESFGVTALGGFARVDG